MKHLLLYFVGILFLKNVKLSAVDDAITNYFKSQIVEDFHSAWRKVRRSYEQAVSIGLKEAFGTETQNVFVPQESPQLARAYYVSDNVVDLLLQNLTMKYQIPRLRPFKPEVNLALSDNLIRVHAELDQIFIEADYYLFRNKSDILWEALDDPYKSSPFTLQEVQKQGKLSIVADNCRLVGIATTVIRGLSVSIGYSYFQVTRCQLRIEIHTPGFGSPPVMVPYFSVDQGRSLEILLSKPMCSEINPKLQGILFSILNTTSIFDVQVGPLRNAQRDLNRQVTDYMRKIVSTMNDITSTSGYGGFVPIPDLKLIWDDVSGVDYPSSSSIILNGMTLNGLETAYCAQVGGPYRTPAVKVVDEIRFQELQVRGKKYIENSTHKEMQDFTIELLDVVVSIKMYMDDGSGGGEEGGEGPEEHQEDQNDYEDEEPRRASDLRTNSNYYLEFVGWRSLEYYVVSGPYNPLHYLVVGYVVDVVPQLLLSHLYGVLDQAIGKVDNSDDDPAAASAQKEGEREGEVRVRETGTYSDQEYEGGDYGDDNYEPKELLACKKNKKNCKRRKKGFNERNKKRSHRHRHRHSPFFSENEDSSDNKPINSAYPLPAEGIVGGGGTVTNNGDGTGGGSGIGGGGDDGFDGGSDAFIDGNLNNHNEQGNFNHVTSNENNGPSVYSDDNVNNYNPNGGNAFYADGNGNNYSPRGSMYQDENVNKDHPNGSASGGTSSENNNNKIS